MRSARGTIGRYAALRKGFTQWAIPCGNVNSDRGVDYCRSPGIPIWVNLLSQRAALTVCVLQFGLVNSLSRECIRPEAH